MVVATWSWDQLWTSNIEVFAVITGVICVALITTENFSRRLSWWNWPIGVASSAAFVHIFWNYELYFNSVLQVFYVLSGLYGAYAWKFGGENRTELLVEKLSVGWTAGLLAGSIIVAWWLSTALDAFGVESSQPFWDALVVTFSFTAQFIMTRKYYQHWFFWILVDIVGVFLFWSQELYLTSVLYFIYGSLCIRGLFTWDRAYKANQPVTDKDPLDPPLPPKG